MVFFLSFLLLAPMCKENQQGGGVVTASDAGTTSAPVAEAGAPVALDVSKCPGCTLAPQASWTFEGIYADPACTDPIAQIDVPACATVPALGPTSLTYVDPIGSRKASESANVTLANEVAPQTARFRKAGNTCVKANETALAVTPPSCQGQRVCRDANGGLTCTACRLLQNGCADYEETRFYSTVTDPALKGAGGGGGGGNVGRLQQCCAALAAQAKALGPSPEAGLLQSAAAQCSAMVAAAGPNGTAPELGALRTLLAGRNVPAICAGF
jgi:hypothetical protein